MTVISNPITATRALPSNGAKPIIVPISLETIPALLNPIKAINSPIPTATAFFKLAGMALIIASLTLKRDRIIKRTPSRKTAVRAICQLYPILPTTV